MIGIWICDGCWRRRAFGGGGNGIRAEWWGLGMREFGPGLWDLELGIGTGTEDLCFGIWNSEDELRIETFRFGFGAYR